MALGRSIGIATQGSIRPLLKFGDLDDVGE
jgi:hypothetical protein